MLQKVGGQKIKGGGQKRKGGGQKANYSGKCSFIDWMLLSHTPAPTVQPTTQAIKYIFQLRQIHLQLQFRQIYL